ncbi:MAG: 4-fold beta flower protein [Ardenticatenaceae bacterium]
MIRPRQCRFVKSDYSTLGYVYDSQGEKVGCTINRRVYDLNGHYVGQVVNERIYDAHGSRVGKVISSHLYDGLDERVGYIGHDGLAYDHRDQPVGQVWLACPDRILRGASAVLLLFSSNKIERN